MKSRSQARPVRRYRRYDAAATLPGRLLPGRPRPIARPSLDLGAYLSNSRVIAGIMLLVVAAVAAWFGLDSRFYVSSVTVTGATRTPQIDIARNSGLGGTHIVWVNAAETEAQILRTTPSLKSAKVSCQLPAKCTLKVEERMPVVAWQFGQAVTWIDADAMTFKPLETKEDLKLVTIEAIEGPALMAGRPADPKVIAAALSVARLLSDVKRYRYSGARGLEFDDARGFPVYLGLADDMSDRVMIWKALRDNLIAREVQPKFVDIRYPLAPYYGE